MVKDKRLAFALTKKEQRYGSSDLFTELDCVSDTFTLEFLQLGLAAKAIYSSILILP